MRFYLHAERQEGALDDCTLDMLHQLLEMRALILLIDGVDEAADLKEIVEDYVCTELVPQGHPIVVTSRPEGVRLRLYQRDFVILNLEALTKDQQQSAIRMQLRESAFYSHLRYTPPEPLALSSWPAMAERCPLAVRVVCSR